SRDGLILVTGTATAPILGTGGVGPGCPEDEVLAPNGKSDVYLGLHTLATGQCKAQYLVSGAGNSEQYGLAIAAGRTWTPMDEKQRDEFWTLAHVVGGMTLPGCDVKTPNSLVLAKMYESGALYCEKTLTLPMDPGTQVSPFGLRVRFDGNGLVDRGWLGINFTGKIDGVASTGGDDALMYVLSGSMAKAKPPLRIYGDGAQFVHTVYVGPGELLIGGRAEKSININNNILVLDNWVGHQPFWAVLDHDLLHLKEPAFSTAQGSGAGAVRGGFSSFNEVYKHMYLGFQVNDSINLGGGEYTVADDSWDMFVGRLNPVQPKHVWSEGVGAGPNNSAGHQTLQYLLPVGEGLFVMIGTYQVALGVTTPPLEGHPSHDRGFIALAGG
ncbi:MAG TPA: hypothetical protein PLV93_13825, partial [Microthrixaceae bacterium]|nr:hypothetical protein [Microthrixaceae bacterium]